jgi:hypothetical protein
MLFPRFLENLQAMRPRFVEIQVGDDQFWGMFGQSRQCRYAIGVREDFVAFVA